jgi:hypothetical protein
MIAKNKLTVNMKRRKQNHKISFHFFSGSPHTPRRKWIGKEIFGFVHATRGSVRGAQGWRPQALRAYDWVSSHHALGAWKDQSLRDWKKVRAKVNISAPNDTSARESEGERRACGAEWGKKPRRSATKWLGGGTEKWADLFLVSYPKITFSKL